MAIGRHPLNSMEQNVRDKPRIFSDKKLLPTDQNTNGRAGRLIGESAENLSEVMGLISQWVSCCKGRLRWVERGAHLTFSSLGKWPPLRCTHTYRKGQAKN